MDNTELNGFSKWSQSEKIDWVIRNFCSDPDWARSTLQNFSYSGEQQEILNGFSENTLTNFPLPYGIAPHFIINGRSYAIPMVIEESSVVAAASAAAKFWKSRGGFTAEVLSTKKEGQVHFRWTGCAELLYESLPAFEKKLRSDTSNFTKNMRERGGGIGSLDLKASEAVGPDIYQLRFLFETCDSMGANFINSVLERAADLWPAFLEEKSDSEGEMEIIMAILSNYTPACVVRAEVSCPVSDLGDFPEGMSAEDFAIRFKRAVDIARHDVYRATTHNKGIFNGIDAVVLATGNDFRAVEAAGHAYASRSGQYRSLSECEIREGIFYFWLEVPLALGTVGGLTHLHPMASLSLDILQQPSARQLMEITATMGLAQNFSALRSLVTVGIQKGHMKMHLYNILIHFKASRKEKEQAFEHFEDQVVSFGSVRNYLDKLRGAANQG
ncbi:MAG: hydroxymethylglutaryl-CoA reductase [Bacteroidetes bacterium]|jgi:hydroxymethylglutaryl-CoA reductase|nr:hydroxymethylglutaryl-CoA reductase [Bacteroidota bacterium]